jgi:hypothetical protein
VASNNADALGGPVESMRESQTPRQPTADSASASHDSAHATIVVAVTLPAAP